MLRRSILPTWVCRPRLLSPALPEAEEASVNSSLACWTVQDSGLQQQTPRADDPRALLKSLFLAEV